MWCCGLVHFLHYALSLWQPCYNGAFIHYRSLYGASNKPWKVCRTIICGQSEVDISRILYILTYFIRCKDLVKSTALVDREDEDDFESPRPRQRLGAFSQSDFAHRLSMSPEPEPCTQFSFHHDLTATSTSASYCSGCRGSLSSPLIPKDTCSASASEHHTEAYFKQKHNPEVVEIEGSSDSGVCDPYKDDEALPSQGQTRKRLVFASGCCTRKGFIKHTIVIGRMYVKTNNILSNIL